MKNPKRLADLAPAPYNPRRISEEDLAALAESQERFGDLSGIVYNRRSGYLVGAHQRIKNLPPDAEIVLDGKRRKPNAQGTVATGYVDVDGERWRYREVDVDEQTERAMNLAANKHSGEWDVDMLGEVLDGLGGLEFPLGFSETEISALTFDPDSVEPASAGEQGDLGKIGTSRTCPECGHEFTA